MRVLVLCEYASLNGGERSLLEVVKRIGVGDVELVIAAPGAGPLADMLQRLALPHLPFDVVVPGSPRSPRTVLRDRLAHLIKGTAATLVHANSVAMSRLLGPVARQLNIPSLGHLRDIIGLSRATLGDLSGYGRLLAVSAATRDWYVSAGLPTALISVEYNGVDLQRFCPRRGQGFLHQELGIPSRSLLVGTIGQIGVRKGMDLFVQAAASVATQRNDVHFLVVGQRYSQKDEAVAFEAELRAAAARGDLVNRLHFLGLRNDVDRILNELTLYVHAARQEPLGRVLLEAGAAGKAIVATNVGGTTEIFPPAAAAARIVPPESSAALADALLTLLAGDAERTRLGAAARRRVAEFFDAKEAAGRLVKHYREVAESPL